MIAYVDSPFQLIQCYELERFEKGISQIIVRQNGKAENDIQLENIINLFGMENVKTVKISNFTEKLFYYLIISIKVLFEKQVVVGDSNSILFKLIHLFNPSDKFLLLDDGVATINSPNENKVFKRFTIFPEYVTKCIVNNFSRIKKNFISNGELKHVIVGTKFIEEKICSESSYYVAIKHIINNLKDNIEIVYIPHRGETDKQLEKLRGYFSFDIQRTDLPIELISIELNIYPASISSILSTAIYSMKVIYEDVPLYTYQLESNLILDRKEPIMNLYKKMRDSNISVFIS